MPIEMHRLADALQGGEAQSLSRSLIILVCGMCSISMLASFLRSAPPILAQGFIVGGFALVLVAAALSTERKGSHRTLRVLASIVSTLAASLGYSALAGGPGGGSLAVLAYGGKPSLIMSLAALTTATVVSAAGTAVSGRPRLAALLQTFLGTGCVFLAAWALAPVRSSLLLQNTGAALTAAVVPVAAAMFTAHVVVSRRGVASRRPSR